MPGRKIYISEYQEKEDDGRTDRRIPTMPVEERAYDTPHTPVPELQLLSNGRYKTWITQSGSSYSALERPGHQPVALGPDPGGFTGCLSTCTMRTTGISGRRPTSPSRRTRSSTMSCFKPDRVMIERSDHAIESRMEITVSPESDLEVRKITLTNHSDKPRHLSVTAYMEPVLAPHADEQAHPAFMNLFIHTEWRPEQGMVFVNRRSREPGRKPVSLACWMVCEREEGRLEITTDRMEFVGRNRTLANPAGMEPGKPLSGMTMGMCWTPASPCGGT